MILIKKVSNTSLPISDNGKVFVCPDLVREIALDVSLMFVSILIFCNSIVQLLNTVVGLVLLVPVELIGVPVNVLLQKFLEI